MYLEKRGTIWGQFDCLEWLLQSMLQTHSHAMIFSSRPCRFWVLKWKRSRSHSVLAVFSLSFSEEDLPQSTTEHTSINVIFFGTLAKDFSESVRQGVGFYETLKYSWEYLENICICTYLRAPSYKKDGGGGMADTAKVDLDVFYLRVCV